MVSTSSFLVIVAARATFSVSAAAAAIWWLLAARGVASWRRSATIVLVKRWRVIVVVVRTTSRGARAPALSGDGHFGLRIRDALHHLALELESIELLDGGAQVVGILIFNEASARVASCFRVNNIGTSLACKVLQVLYPESM